MKEQIVHLYGQREPATGSVAGNRRVGRGPGVAPESSVRLKLPARGGRWPRHQGRTRGAPAAIVCPFQKGSRIPRDGVYVPLCLFDDEPAPK